MRSRAHAALNGTRTLPASAHPRAAALLSTTSPIPFRAGGELGFFTRGKMVKEFDSVVFSEEPGFVYGPGEGHTVSHGQPSHSRSHLRRRARRCHTPSATTPSTPPHHAPLCCRLTPGASGCCCQRVISAAAALDHSTATPLLTLIICPLHAVRTDFGHHLIFIHSCREPKEA